MRERKTWEGTHELLSVLADIEIIAVFTTPQNDRNSTDVLLR